MKCEDIARALRCTSAPGGPTGDCKGCPYYRVERLTGEIRDKLGADTLTGCDVDKVGMDAADRIEQLAAENQSLTERLDENIGAAKMWERRYEELRAKLPRWRSAEEELPEKDGWYLCRCEHGDPWRLSKFHEVIRYCAEEAVP